MPIDINQLREEKGGNPDLWRQFQAKRFLAPELIDEIIALDNEWRKASFQAEQLRKEAGQLSKIIGQKKKKKENADEEVAKVQEIKRQIPQEEARASALLEQVTLKIEGVGNIVDDDVPVSKDEALNKTIRTFGEIKRPEKFYHHHEILHMIDGYEPEKGADVAGHRAYYLKGPGALLNMALVQYSTAFLAARDYCPVQPPFFMNKDIMAGIAQLGDFDEQLYHVQGEKGDEKYLIATSEQPLCALHRNDWLAEKDLPIRYAGVSTCFRKEAGSHGRDTWGIFRVHQFEKVEQFCITEPEKSQEMHEEMIRTAEAFYQSLNLAYRVVTLVSGELNLAATKKYDLEAWFPGYDDYRELVSASNCTDYQSRSMGIRCGHKKLDDKEKRYVHMLNATLCATTRTLCCILENYQTEDGVVVPEALVPFMGGKTFLPFVKAKPENLQSKKMAKAAAKKDKEGKAKGGKGDKKTEKKPAAAGAAGAKAEPKAAAKAAPKAEAKAAPKAAAKAAPKAKQASKPKAAAAAAPPAPAVAAAKKVAAASAAAAAPSVSTPAGLAALNDRLAKFSYVAGFAPTAEDAAVFSLLPEGGVDAKYPHTTRWFNHMLSYSAEERGSWQATEEMTAAGTVGTSTLFKA